MEWVFEISFVFFLILLNGFFAGAEIAILTARRGRLEQLAKNGNTAARTALNLASDPSRFLATVQVGITIVGTLAAAYGGSELVEHVSDALADVSFAPLARHRNAVALAVVTALVAFLSLVFGELVPKRAALHRAEQLARFVSLPMYALSTVTRPIVTFLGTITTLILFFLGMRKTKQPTVSVEDINHLLETGTAEGVVEAAEKQVAMEALRLGDRRVRDVMRPRVDVDAIDIDTPSEEVIGAVAMSGFSRLPVYRDSLDHVMGFVYIKDVFQQYYLGRPIDLQKILHPPVFVPETLTLEKLLRMFQEHRTQLAIVLDEFGGTAGMVTFEDVLEELVGDIHDEHRRDEEQMIVKRDEDSWLVDGRVSVREVLRAMSLDVELANDDLDVSSISGVILSCMGRLPKIGDVAKWTVLQLEVVDMDGPRIDRVLVRQLPPDQVVRTDDESEDGLL